MKRIRDEFDVCEESWGRIARSVGKEAPASRRREALTLEEAQMIEEQAAKLLEGVYTFLEQMPEGLQTAVLKRVVEDLSLMPMLDLVKARRKSALVWRNGAWVEEGGPEDVMPGDGGVEDPVYTTRDRVERMKGDEPIELPDWWEVPEVNDHVSFERYGSAVVQEVYPDGTYLVTFVDVQGGGQGMWNQALIKPVTKVTKGVFPLR